MIGFARVSNHRFTDTSKALQLQVVSAETDDGSSTETGFADAFGAWCVVAVPLRPETDALGNVTASCEALVDDGADERTVVGTRDIRTSKWVQDLQPGDSALINGYGSRLSLREKSVSLNHGGGFLSFDSDSGVVSLVGIPASLGAASPYLAIDATSIGMVSSSGQASLACKGADVTINGGTTSVRSARVDLGMGAAEPIVTYSMLMRLIVQISASLVALGKPALVPPPPGRTIRVPIGG